MKGILVCLILSLSALTIRAEPDYKFDIFIESLCPYSRDFVWKSLSQFIRAVYDNNLQDEIFNEVQLNLYLYGIVHQNEQGEDTCQHGEFECAANKVISCVNKYYNSGESLRTFYSFIDCYTHYIGRFYEGPFNTTKYCAQVVKSQKLPPIDVQLVETCANGTEGTDLFVANGKYQHSTHPELKYVPFIALNGEHSKDDESRSRISFLKEYCSLRDRDSKPQSVLCNDENIQKYGHAPPETERKSHKKSLSISHKFKKLIY